MLQSSFNLAFLLWSVESDLKTKTKTKSAMLKYSIQYITFKVQKNINLNLTFLKIKSKYYLLYRFFFWPPGAKISTKTTTISMYLWLLVVSDMCLVPKLLEDLN